MRTCPVCGEESPDGFRFCGSCGATLTPVAAPREVRKTVTVVFCDVTGSTATALMLVDLLLQRGAYDEAAGWCAAAREMMSEDDLTDVIAVDSREGFLAARSGDTAEGDRLSARAVAVAATIDLYEPKALAYEWRAR